MKFFRLPLLILWLLTRVVSCSSPSEFRLISESPDKQYRVDCDNKGFDFQISCKIDKEGLKVKKTIGLYYPPPPPSFSETHPDHQWIANNVFWMGDKNRGYADQSDEILIQNKTSSTITALAITQIRRQALIIFDLAPNAVLKLDVQPICLYGPLTPSFDIEGVTSKDQILFSRITEFPNLSNYIGLLHFCVIITDRGIEIKCNELEGEYEDPEDLDKFLKANPSIEAGTEKAPRPKMMKVYKGSCGQDNK